MTLNEDLTLVKMKRIPVQDVGRLQRLLNEVEKEYSSKLGSPSDLMIGRKPVMNYVLAALTMFHEGKTLVRVQARGRAISRAVDAVELLRRGFMPNLNIRKIELGTEEVYTEKKEKRGKQKKKKEERRNGCNVSTMSIDIAGLPALNLDKVLKQLFRDETLFVSDDDEEILISKVAQRLFNERVDQIMKTRNEVKTDTIIESSNIACSGLNTLDKILKAGHTERELVQTGMACFKEFSGVNHTSRRFEWWMRVVSGEHTNSLFPFPSNNHVSENQLVVESVGINLDGVFSEIERSHVLGIPTDEQQSALNAISEASSKAIRNVRPREKASNINQVIYDTLKENGFETFMTHDGLHGIGENVHQMPLLSYIGDQQLQPGMVLCVKPAIYIPKIGGFRRTDMVFVTKQGSKLLTKYD